MISKSIAATLLLTSLFTCQTVFADKTLNAKNSTVSFVSIKKGTTGEVHSFKKIAGNLTDKGELTLTIDLNSVDTTIPVRDERMQSVLFETSKFPNMILTATVDHQIAEGEIKQIQAEATLDLHGMKEKIKVDVMVANIGGKLLAVSQKPVIISAATFGLEAGVKKLQEIAKLPSIATAVPVNFVLVFEH